MEFPLNQSSEVEKSGCWLKHCRHGWPFLSWASNGMGQNYHPTWPIPISRLNMIFFTITFAVWISILSSLQPPLATSDHKTYSMKFDPYPIRAARMDMGVWPLLSFWASAYEATGCAEPEDPEKSTCGFVIGYKASYGLLPNCGYLNILEYNININIIYIYNMGICSES